MSTEDTDQKNGERQQDSDNDPERAGQLADKPEPDESAKEKAKEMMKSYDNDIKTAVLPGSGGTVTGTAVNEWLDDDGNPKFGKDEGKDEGQERDGEKAESTSDGEG